MFGTDCGFAEWIVILIVAVIVFGPKGLPDVIRKVGRFMGMIRHASDEFKAQIMAMDRELQAAAEHELKPLTDAASGLVENDADVASQENENCDPPLPPGPEAYDPTYEAFYAAQAPAPEDETEPASEEPVEKEPTA